MVDPLASALGADLPTWARQGAETGADGLDGEGAVGGDGAETFAATGSPVSVPMPVGPAGDMPIPTGAEPGEDPGVGSSSESADPTERR
jgi:hypothetical protein